MKVSTLYECSNCGAQFSKWSGRCLECGAWGTLKSEIVDEKIKSKKEIAQIPAAEIIELNKIKTNEINSERLKTGIGEIDRVLGGGIVPGSLVLLSGEPGIGKSTIVAQIANAVGKAESPVFYASGEESAVQVKERLSRLNCDLEKIKFLNEINAEKIAAAAEKARPVLMIVDSIQTMYSSFAESEPGSLNQIRAVSVKFLEMAKQNNIAVILIGHMTKDGQLAGPKALEHIVDTVLYLEAENLHDYRILRATKNRFGSVNEIGIFEMAGNGFREVKNPSAIFLEQAEENLSGSVISCVMEGTRPFLVEIQALVTKTVFGYPQRKASGFDLNRLQVLAAVITKRTKANLTAQDIILNVVGGMRINDPALDLAVCASIISSLLNQAINRKTIFLGEIGLGGEARNISKLEQRLAEAEKLGFTSAAIPNTDVKTKIKVEKIKNLERLLNLISR